MHPNQCLAAMVELAELCTLGGVFNWSWYLLNELIDDATEAQHEPTYKFHYSWLFILILFTMWVKPLDYVQMDVPLPCHGARYQNLWDDIKDLTRWKDNNIEFFFHAKALSDVVHWSHRICTTTIHR